MSEKRYIALFERDVMAPDETTAQKRAFSFSLTTAGLRLVTVELDSTQPSSDVDVRTSILMGKREVKKDER
jgi:hypothetical protein